MQEKSIFKPKIKYNEGKICKDNEMIHDNIFNKNNFQIF